MRRLLVAVVSVLVVLLGTSTAEAVDEIVTVEGGPVTFGVFAPQCNDIAFLFDEQRSFVLQRTGPATGPLTVGYQLSGTAQPGIHFEPLPGSVTFAPGQTSVVVGVVPLPTPGGALVNLTLTVPGDAATIQFVSPPPPGPVECGYRFTGDPWNTTQTVAVGQPLHPLTLEQFVPPVHLPAAGRFRLVSGTLPYGATLTPDGSFAGAPLVPGTYVSAIEACRPQPPGTCVTTTLTVNVQGSFGDVIGAVLSSVSALVQQLLAGLPFGVTPATPFS